MMSLRKFFDGYKQLQRQTFIPEDGTASTRDMNFSSARSFDNADTSIDAQQTSLSNEQFEPLPISYRKVQSLGQTGQDKVGSSHVTTLPNTYGYNIYHGKLKSKQSMSWSQNSHAQMHAGRTSETAETAKHTLHSKPTAASSPRELFAESIRQTIDTDAQDSLSNVGKEHVKHGRNDNSSKPGEHGRRHRDQEWMYCLEQLRNEHGKQPA